MKIKTALFSIMVMLFMVINCSPTYPQEVEVRVNYALPVDADSAKIILWIGDNPAECPLFEDGDWETLDKTSLIINDVPIISSVHSYMLTQPGKSIKIAMVVFDYGWSSDLATTSFYTLPQRPQKATILSVQIIIP